MLDFVKSANSCHHTNRKAEDRENVKEKIKHHAFFLMVFVATVKNA